MPQLYRSKELKITRVYQGIHNKLNKLYEITDKLNTVAYIGDDINDLLFNTISDSLPVIIIGSIPFCLRTSFMPQPSFILNALNTSP